MNNIPTAPSVVQDNAILLCEVGSTAHGVTDGNDDLDLMGVFIEPPEYVIGTRKKEHWVSSTGTDDSQNGPDDVDVTYYSLRKFANLALKGNPSVLNLFFAPVKEWDTLGALLVNEADIFLSRQALPRYLGYMQGQLSRMESGLGHKRVKRPELEAKYGFDSKAAYHVLRLGIQGRELMETGNISMPMSKDNRELLVGVRTGKYSLAEVLEMAREVEERLKVSAGVSVLPEDPDTKAIDKLLVKMYQEYWASTGQLSA